MSEADGRGTCQGCGEYDFLPEHLCEHDWREGLKQAGELLRKFARGPDGECMGCGEFTGPVDRHEHAAACPVNAWLKEYAQ